VSRLKWVAQNDFKGFDFEKFKEEVKKAMEGTKRGRRKTS